MAGLGPRHHAPLPPDGSIRRKNVFLEGRNILLCSIRKCAFKRSRNDKVGLLARCQVSCGGRHCALCTVSEIETKYSAAVARDLALGLNKKPPTVRKKAQEVVRNKNHNEPLVLSPACRHYLDPTQLLRPNSSLIRPPSYADTVRQ